MRIDPVQPRAPLGLYTDKERIVLFYEQTERLGGLSEDEDGESMEVGECIGRVNLFGDGMWRRRRRGRGGGGRGGVEGEVG